MSFRRLLWLVVLALLLLTISCADDDDSDDDDTDGDDDDTSDDDTSDNDDTSDDDTGDDDDTPLPLHGIYEINGDDAQWGSYAGRAEIRLSEDGKTYQFVRLIEYVEAAFEGDAIAVAWAGTLDGAVEGFVAVTALAQIGFIDSYEEYERDPEMTEPLPVQGTFTQTSEGAYQGQFVGGDLIDATETWTWSEPSGDEPLWENQRQLIVAHAPPPDWLHDLFWLLFSSFHAREEMDPYRDRDDFNAAVHYTWLDPTDFDFYRENPDVLRVIQQVVDPISLAETRLRNRAYRQTLAEKADWYDQDMHDNHRNGAGFIANSWWEDEELVYDADMSGMLWTGVYIGSQALRYLSTGDEEALEHVVEGVQGQIVAYDIVPEIGQFARSIRLHDDNMPGDWLRGEGDYSDYDYKPGGNNDMLHGYQVGFFFAHLAMPDEALYNGLRDELARVLDELEQHHPDAGDGMINEMKMNMLLYMLTGELPYRQRYRQLLNFFLYDFFLEDLGNGSFFIYGISDWSGDHLNAQSMIVLTWMAEVLDDPSLPELQRGCRRTYWHMHGARLPLFLTTMAALGYEDPSPDLIEQGVWRLREFPCPKVQLNIDWRINPDFTYSPIPELPWKFDWATGDRLSGLYGYTYFEQAPGHFMYRSNPFRGYYGNESEVSLISAEYLYIYWLMMYRGLITGEE